MGERLEDSHMPKKRTRGLASLGNFSKVVHEHLFEVAPEGIAVLSRNGTVVAVNQTFSDFSGWSKDEIEGKSFLSFDQPEARLMTMRDFNTVLGGRKLGPVLGHLQRKRGKPLPIEYVAIPIFRHKRVDGVLTFIRDITKRRKLENDLELYTRNLERKVVARTSQLRHEKAESEAVLKSIGEGIFVADKNLRITLINKAAADMLGWKISDALGKPADQVVPIVNSKGDPIPLHERPLLLSLEKNQSTSTRPGMEPFYYIRKDGTRFPVAIITSPVVVARKTIASVSVFRNITIGRELDKAKKEFVSLASHQLRTPLSISSWYLEKLGTTAKFAEGSKEAGYLDTIYQSNRRMSELVDALLHTSRIEMGTLALSPVPTVCQDILDRSLFELAPTITTKGLRIETQYEYPPLAALIDPKAFAIVCDNLLSNACKYTPEGGSIKVGVRTEDNQVVVEVSDTGFGIPTHQQSEIFSKLFRADNVVDKDTDGTGLGLYIVKSIIDQSHGSIDFHSEENAGTTFTVSLPKQKISS